ncbi:MAG: SusC/RagA family TonB-linked outer membrane protein [Cytophagaceae bacterium]|nr:SusC/RagA family TonB-linked outer membrane protein [Gemmatimonadaceae bacterium]
MKAIALLGTLLWTVPALQEAQSMASIERQVQTPIVGPLLQRRASLDVRDVSLPRALDELMRSSGVALAYSPSMLERSVERVTCRCVEQTVAQALDQLLAKAAATYFEMGGRVIVLRSASQPEIPAPVSMAATNHQIARPAFALPLPATLAPASDRILAAAIGTVTGRITDASSQAPIAGVAVTISGTRLGASTDDDGRYTIRGIPDGRHTLSVRRLGYRQLERGVVMPGEVTADFSLERTAAVLATVVATATGDQRSVELGHAVGIVRMDSLIREAPVANVSEALTGRVAGVMINGQNGYGNTVSPIRIRGLNSFSLSNNPIVIVDGARIESTPTGGTQASLCGTYAACPSSRLGDLAIDQIESIEVAKGPAAATLYGTDAANGVLVIRTKRGRQGRARWEAYAEGGRNYQAESLVQPNYFAWGRRTSGQAVQCVLALLGSGGCTQDSLTTFNPLLNADATLLGTGQQRSTGLQVSGGAERFRYFLSGSFEGNRGWLKMPDADRAIQERIRRGPVPEEYLHPDFSRRVNARSNTSAQFGERADLTLSVGAHTSYNRVPVSFAYQSSSFGLGYRDPAFDGYAAAYVSRPGDLLSVRNADYVTRYTSSLAGTYRPTAWLASRFTAGLDYSGQRTDFLQRNGEGGNFGPARLGQRTQGQNEIRQYSLDGSATATKVLTSSLTSRTSAGIQYNRRGQVITTLSGSQLPPGGETVTGAAVVTGTEVHADNVVAGAFLQEEMGWRERLFLTAAVRADGSSSFGKNLRTLTYPKASFSWILSEESFFPDLPGDGTLRLRGAYGQSGVQPPSTAGITRLLLSNAAIGGTPQTAASPLFTGFGNPDVKPERQAEFEGGVDLEAWRSRVRIEATYFSRLSSDALVSVPFAASVGGGSYFANVGSVSNKGFEALVSVRPWESPNVALDLTLNATLVRNKLVSAGPNAPAGFFATLPGNARHRVGYPLYGLWARRIRSFADTDNDGIIDVSEVAVADSEAFHGAGHPRRQTALTTSLSLWREVVRISAILDARGGYSSLNADYSTRCLQFRNCEQVNVKSTPLAEQAAAVVLSAPFSTNTGFIGNGSYVRLREVSVSVRLDPRLFRYLGASGGSISVAGRNLALWTDYLGDPEVVTSSVAGTDQTNNLTTPPLARSVSVRLNLSC